MFFLCYSQTLQQDIDNSLKIKTKESLTANLEKSDIKLNEQKVTSQTGELLYLKKRNL
jgi:hypothetical protein